MDVLARIIELPPLSASVLRLGELVEDPDATPQDIAAVIQQDAALAAKLLRLVNSASFGLSAGVDNLERAVCLAGYSTIYQLALCLHSLQLLGKTSPQSAEQLMRHALRVAHTAQMLAERLRLPAPGRFYTGGLLHDIGRLALQVVAPAEMAEWQKRVANSTDRLALEQQLFGIDHQDAGARLAHLWRYPESLRVVIAGHHHPEASQNQLVCIVAYADGAVRQWFTQEFAGVVREPPLWSRAVIGPLVVDESFLELMKLRVEQDSLLS